MLKHRNVRLLTYTQTFSVFCIKEKIMLKHAEMFDNRLIGRVFYFLT